MAVALLEQHAFGSAISKLLEALRTQKELPICHIADSSMDQCMLLTELMVNNKSSRFCPDHTFIYDQGIRLPSSATDSDMILAAVLFNAALAYHRYASGHKYPPPFLLHKAKRLYELAANVAEGKGDVLFPFAVINNLALIEHKLGNTTQSIEYFEFLAHVKNTVLLNDEQHGAC
ncbi:unnamed protein product [Cylindrotheca closterium]|uniref:Uncharacterized protein n=1 Tax=Cylindrotheca closterium TaxID=2856 RepID=A0AAD2JPU9_9STRA|nr:unnamed protein product [Cylindrotheca closterium]